MDLVVFENNKPWVIDEFREGRFDYVELASDVAETKFFQFLFGQQVVDRLVQHYPSPRDRHHVPLWMYVCSQLSLRLHGQHSFHSYPLIVRAGGLVDALGPEVARRQVDPESGNLTLECAGFNDRNLYPRQTPCDQDFLRKLARDTEPEQLEDWYNRRVVTVYKELGAFDSDGLFIADGTYLFVPDNPRYERGLTTVALRRAQQSREQETGTGNDRASAGSLPLATLLQSGAAFALRRGRRALRGGGRARAAGR